jgi:hypothetical protein
VLRKRQLFIPPPLGAIKENMRITDQLSENKYVAFIDVLGFKNLVESKGDNLNSYFDIVTHAIEEFKNSDFPIESQLVSDSTILATKKSEDGLKQLLYAVQTIQSKCAMENIWLRGAITIGEIYFNSEKNIVVGKGLSDAYILESQEKFPRVVIDPKVIIDFEDLRKFCNTFNVKTWNPYRREIPLIYDYEMDVEKNLTNDAIFVAFAERIFADYSQKLDLIHDHLKAEMYHGQLNYGKYLWLKSYFLTSAKTSGDMPNVNVGFQFQAKLTNL